LIIAVGGATLFGNADSFAELIVGRAMIGLGVAASLMAGLKAIVVWFPRDRIAFVNGGMIMLGSLGAVTATTPTDWLLNLIGWRSLFEVLTIATVVTSGLIHFSVPKRYESPRRLVTPGKPLTLGSIFSDPRFLRIAPLSATCIGSSWAMQSLWAASWLADVEGLDHQAIVNQLFTMALGISLGAVLLGTMADRLRKRGIATEVLLAVFGGLFLVAELALVLRLPLPSILPWSVVSVVGAGTVLSYAIIADYFPDEIAARANGALNLLHWVPQDGHYPTIAYQSALGVNLMLQATALIWFSVPWLRSLAERVRHAFERPDVNSGGRVELVPAVADGSILQPSAGVDW
jgi:predicted MFS family arabinose efflux permease